MQTPVWSSQPITSRPIRTVDLFPVMLSWLGAPLPERIDGESVCLPGQDEDVTGLKARAPDTSEMVLSQ